MIHQMGGNVLHGNYIGSEATHLIADFHCEKKHTYADTFRLPIVSVKWVKALWEMKDNTSIYCTNEKLVIFSCFFFRSFTY